MRTKPSCAKSSTRSATAFSSRSSSSAWARTSTSAPCSLRAARFSSSPSSSSSPIWLNFCPRSSFCRSSAGAKLSPPARSSPRASRSSSPLPPLRCSSISISTATNSADHPSRYRQLHALAYSLQPAPPRAKRPATRRRRHSRHRSTRHASRQRLKQAGEEVIFIGPDEEQLRHLSASVSAARPAIRPAANFWEKPAWPRRAA